MKELLRSNDPVRISWAKAVLDEAEIGCVVLDAYTASIEGSIAAIMRRVMVASDDLATARRVIGEAEAAL